jgi:metal-sulfur cluster biosynthetic enzyme
MDGGRYGVQQAQRERDVWRQLQLVLDPELDEPITDLQFVDGVEVVDSEVAVTFRLPTYWCAPNFAFLMAADIREQVSRLDWVGRVDVRLVDHCTSGVINEGVALGRSFDEVFGSEAAGNLDELRSVFRRKAFQARQERLLRQLRASGWSVDAIIRLTISELRHCALMEAEHDRLRARYLEVRCTLGLPSGGDALAITTVDGDVISADSFESYLRGLRKCRLNMEINTHLCRGLLAVRYGVQLDWDDGSSGSEHVRTAAAGTISNRPAPVVWMARRPAT